jgi:hypothetical protein
MQKPPINVYVRRDDAALLEQFSGDGYRLTALIVLSVSRVLSRWGACLAVAAAGFAKLQGWW